MEEGNLFETGPDGFCYLIERGHEGRAYAIHTSQVRGVEGLQDPEGASVTFTLEDGRPTNIRIAPIAIGAGTSR